MSESWCGKSCEECLYRESEDCPGCKDGPGSPWSGNCPIAQCCRSKGHETCGTCSFAPGCEKYSGRFSQPEERRRSSEQEAKVREHNAEQAGFMEKWIGTLFWLSILGVVAGVVAGLLSGDTFKEIPSLYALYWVGSVLVIVKYIGDVVVFSKLQDQCELYRKAVIYRVIYIPLNLLAIFSLNALGTTAGVCASVLFIVSRYYEINAHAQVLHGVSEALSESWTKLWRWYVVCIIALVISMLLFVIFTALVALVLIAVAIAIIVLDVLNMVYLWRMKECYKSLKQ